jgi:mRNA-degrading endonuclease toxin of MazEF toxin-antitoxin module
MVLEGTTRRQSQLVDVLAGSEGVSRPSVVILDQIRAIKLERLDSRIAKLPPNKIAGVGQACRFALGLPD